MPAMTVLRPGPWFGARPEFWRAKRDGGSPQRPRGYPKSKDVITPDVAVLIRAALVGFNWGGSLSRRVRQAARESGRLLQGDMMNERVGMTMHQFPSRTILAIDFGYAQ